jgi:hypothetical protein
MAEPKTDADYRGEWLARQIIVTRDNPMGRIVVARQTAHLLEACIYEGPALVATATANTNEFLRALLNELNVEVKQ